MKAAEKLKSLAGGHMKESIGGLQGGGVALAPPGAGATNRYHGIGRIKAALEIPLDRVVPDAEQPRKEFDPDALDRLAGSLRDRGQIQPIRVRWDEGLQKWVIIAGERRWRAARLAGLATIAAVEAQGVPTSDEALEDQLVENCLRDDLKPIEQARAFEALMNRRNWTQAQLAEHLHLSPPTVSRALSLLTLPPAVQAEVDSGRVPPTIGHELARVEDPAAREDLAARAVRGELTREEVRERRARQRPLRVEYRTPRGKVTIETAPGDEQDEAVIEALEDALSRARAKRPETRQDAA
jgi:ParB family transcriptional regulator, chromosome partitioning protein